jgi:quinol-cytochrome oxidoreductase complex cytochrome b subunit
MKKNILIAAIILIVNILAYYLLFPFAEKTITNHYEDNSYFGTIYSVISALGIFLGVLTILKNRNIKRFLLLIILSIATFYWAFRFFSLQCLECARGA